jgi:predicted TIM-barrel fold metal-dependent hydrolase
MIPDNMRNELFGHTELHDVAQTFGIREVRKNHANQTTVPGLTADITPINHDTVWNLKGPAAPSAIDMSRRPEVLDVMGIERQLVYPTFGLMSVIMFMDPNAHKFFGFDPVKHDRRKLGREGIVAHNKWAARTTQSTSSRARPVGIVLTDTVEGMIDQTERMIADGIRALMIPANAPPAGTSPADPALDPFWRLCADANVPVTIHLGTEFGFLSSTAWSENVETFSPSSKSTLEFVIEPLRASTMHFCAENFLAALILGGVFERHPTLRFGVIELGAAWVGALGERLDMWAEKQFQGRLSKVLTMRPSAYLARNVRVTPFHFEPVSYYLERYPHLADVYCYSSDFPHFEGGTESIRIFAEGLSEVTGADFRASVLPRHGKFDSRYG